MEKFGRHKYARQLLRNQAYDERAEPDEPEELEDEPRPRRLTSAGASAAVSLQPAEGSRGGTCRREPVWSQLLLKSDRTALLLLQECVDFAVRVAL